jgi:predicted acyltransferase
MGTGSQRWDALDLLRGFSIIGMLLNLEAGSWSHVYPWLEHAKWEGATPIDLVAPVFLFCVGAVLPLSLARRLDKGAGRGAAAGHVLWRTFALVGIGFFLNLYPAFDWAHVRIPGVLQRIGLTYGLSGLFLLACARCGPGGARVPVWPVAAAGVLILIAYFALLYFAPVPGYGAPRFDPVGSWPSVVDRAVFGPPHMFRWWPVDGKVVFDPEGILSTWPATAQVLFGALIGLIYARGGLKRPLFVVLPAGAALIALAVALSPVCPIIKNIWTPTFVLFTSGFALVVLALLSLLAGKPEFSPIAFPARVFGSNPLLAYILSFLLDPLWDLTWIKNGAAAPTSIRDFAQASFETVLAPDAASLLFGLAVLLLLFLVNLACWRGRWFLKL